MVRNNTIAVLLLSMNQRETTLRSLASLARVQAPRPHIILWDNGSTDGTCAAVQTAYPDVLIHHSPHNVGVASGRNRAVAMARAYYDARFVCFLDNDMTVEPDFHLHLAAPFEHDSRLAQTTGKIMDLNNSGRIYGAGGCRLSFWRGNTRHIGYGEEDVGQYDTPRRCIPSGGCMMVRTETFFTLGGFDTLFNPYGPEDLDFGLRARKSGYHALYVPEAMVYHETRPSRTFEGGAYSEKYANHRGRHWIQFLNRHASPAQKAAFYTVGGPYLLASVLIRESRRGNTSAIRGLLRGARTALTE